MCSDRRSADDYPVQIQSTTPSQLFKITSPSAEPADFRSQAAEFFSVKQHTRVLNPFRPLRCTGFVRRSTIPTRPTAKQQMFTLMTNWHKRSNNPKNGMNTPQVPAVCAQQSSSRIQLRGNSRINRDLLSIRRRNSRTTFHILNRSTRHGLHRQFFPEADSHHDIVRSSPWAANGAVNQGQWSELQESQTRR